MININGSFGISLDNSNEFTPSEGGLIDNVENETTTPAFINEFFFENINCKTLTSFNDNNNNIFENNNLSKIININENYYKSKNMKMLGRKKKDSKEIEKHTKFDDDNIIRKIKPLFYSNVIDFLNKKLKKNNIVLYAIINGTEYKSKKFLKIKNTQNYEISKQFNLELFNKKIKDVLSEELSAKCKNYPKTFHKIAINNLYEENFCQDIISLLELTYLDCLKYYRGDDDRRNDMPCLVGLDEYFKNLDLKLEKKGNGVKYITRLKNLIKRIDVYYKEKKSRKTESSEDTY